MLNFENKAFMLIGLPNTGTDWFAEQICHSSNKVRYFREFFNPITNPDCSNDLAIFGCEDRKTIDRIASSYTWDEYKKVLKNTWEKYNYNFTKENYSLFQIHHHHKIFKCFVLYRELEFCLPSVTRYYDVNRWYNAIYESMINNESILDASLSPYIEFCKKHANNLDKKAIAAHVIGYKQIFLVAKEYNLPIVEYNKLLELNYQELVNYLSFLKNIYPEKLAKNIIQTRKKRDVYIQKINCNKFITDLINL